MKDKKWLVDLDEETLAFFRRMEFIVGEPRRLCSGKEATVYRCEAHPSTGLGYLAVKFYRPKRSRGFQNSAVYREGRGIDDERMRRAAKKKTEFGREVEFALWVGAEFETLRLLHRAGADVPRPVSCSESIILMEYVGSAEHPAPALQDVALPPAAARAAFERVWWNIETMLECHRIHGDLSPYNILWHEGAVRIIDFPQAIDPRHNNNARDLLHRDIDHVCRYFADAGISADPEDLTDRLWRRYTRARLYSYR